MPCRTTRRRHPTALLPAQRLAENEAEYYWAPLSRKIAAHSAAPETSNPATLFFSPTLFKRMRLKPVGRDCDRIIFGDRVQSHYYLSMTSRILRQPVCAAVKKVF